MSRTGNIQIKSQKKRKESAHVKKSTPRQEKNTPKKLEQKENIGKENAKVSKSAGLKKHTPMKTTEGSMPTTQPATGGLKKVANLTAKNGLVKKEEKSTAIKSTASDKDLIVGVQRQVLKRIANLDLTIVFDTETTGLPKHRSTPVIEQPYCIEFGAIKYEGYKEVERLEFLINPGFDISAEITKITGITNDLLVGQPKFISYLKDIQDFFLGVRRVVGHNVWFDLDMLMFDLTRVGAERKFSWAPEAIDTIDLSMDIKGYRLKLGDLYSHLFNGETFVSHRAMSDTVACGRCYHKLIEA